MRITSYINRGNSFPVVLEDQEKKYFVKLRAGMSGKHALVSEWIGNKLGTQLNIKTQNPTWIELQSDVRVDDIHIEVRDLINKSYGINIGFRYQETATEISANELSQLSKKEANEIFLFDLMMINLDRTRSNTNLMKVGDEIISVDYESSQLIQELIEDKNLLDDNRILQCLRDNPLYEDIQNSVINAFILKTEKINIQDILGEIPTPLLAVENRNKVIQGIESKRNISWGIKETMNRLKAIKPQTKEDNKRRMNKNQEDFLRKSKENSTSNNSQTK